MAVFIPTYFSPISQIGMIYQSDNLEFEVCDNFQKQTYRNRCYIYGANGKQLLNIPVTSPKKEGRKKTRDILVEENSNWQDQHYKSLKIAYSSSPFFEFYEDDLIPIFNKNYKYLLDVNIDTFQFINDALDLQKEYTLTQTYKDQEHYDFRNLASVKFHPTCSIESYIQIFDDKFGSIHNLSILDLLFMEGPNTISFLEENSLTLG